MGCHKFLSYTYPKRHDRAIASWSMTISFTRCRSFDIRLCFRRITGRDNPQVAFTTAPRIIYPLAVASPISAGRMPPYPGRTVRHLTYDPNPGSDDRTRTWPRLNIAPSTNQRTHESSNTRLAPREMISVPAVIHGGQSARRRVGQRVQWPRRRGGWQR